MPPFATGLSGPTGICLGPNRDLYVAEYGSDEVTIINAGGDLSSATPFAIGISEPLKLFCTPTAVWVAEYGGARRVVDITAGGDFGAASGFAYGGPWAQLWDIHRTSHARWYVSDHLGQLWDVTAGGDYAGATAFATSTGGIMSSLAEHEGALYLGMYHTGRVVNVGGGGDLSTAPAFALQTSLGGLDVVGDHFWAITLDGLVHDIAAGRDFTSAPPFATGLGNDEVADFAYYHGCGDGLVWEEGDDSRSNGLGLSIAKALIEAQHGNIHIKSTAGKGTQVHIFLPTA